MSTTMRALEQNKCAASSTDEFSFRADLGRELELVARRPTDKSAATNSQQIRASHTPVSTLHQTHEATYGLDFNGERGVTLQGEAPDRKRTSAG